MFIPGLQVKHFKQLLFCRNVTLFIPHRPIGGVGVVGIMELFRLEKTFSFAVIFNLNLIILLNHNNFNNLF